MTVTNPPQVTQLYIKGVKKKEGSLALVVGVASSFFSLSMFTTQARECKTRTTASIRLKMRMLNPFGVAFQSLVLSLFVRSSISLFLNSFSLLYCGAHTNTQSVRRVYFHCRAHTQHTNENIAVMLPYMQDFS